LKGNVSRQYLCTNRWGNGYTTTLPLDVFTQRSFVADYIRLKLNFIKNQKRNRFLSHLSLARWKACGRLFVRHNWTFSLSLTVETL